MSDKYPSLSPYNYCAWNPVKLVDPDGNFTISPKLKAYLAKGITYSAENAHRFYSKASLIAQSNPQLISSINKTLQPIRKSVGMATDMNTQTMGWNDLTNIWLFELGNKSSVVFGQNDNTTLDLKKQQGVNQARAKAIENIQKGILDDVNLDWTYGQDQFYEGISSGNKATSFLGSYNTNVSIRPGECNGEYFLDFEVKNTSGWESATRLRKDTNNNGIHNGIIPNKSRGSGINLGGNFHQKWVWSEKISTE